MLRLLALLLTLIVVPATVNAQRPNAIQPELISEYAARPGGEVELALVMRTSPGWHGYWLNPGDAGLPMQIDWRLPPGYSVGPLRYPVPTRLTVAGIMNYVYERDYAVLTRLKVPAGANGTVPIRALARWLACTDKVCVPESGEIALDLPVGIVPIDRSTQFDEWRRALPRPLATPGRFEIAGDMLHVAIPLPASVPIGEPYLFPAIDGAVDYAAPQRFRRLGDTLIAELPRRSGRPDRFTGLLALGDGRGLSFEARPGDVADGGRTVGELGVKAVLVAMLGALVGGILLNLMPCVFPILALKALHLAKSGGAEREARRDALAYTAGAVIGTGALGAILLAIRAGGSAAGWAFQLQDPRTILALLLLTTAITLNLLRAFELPVIARTSMPSDSFGTGALAAFVATPCAGPFLGAALGTALVLPPAAAVLIFAALGLGLALPFVAVAFIPALRRRLPKPGPWMVRLQRFLAIPMAATAVACLWLLWRLGGAFALEIGLVAAAIVTLMLVGAGWMQRRARQSGYPASLIAVAVAVAAIAYMPERPASVARAVKGAAPWSETAVTKQQARGQPVFVYFTADWCLTCKANEIGAINRAEVQSAFRAAGVRTFVGDWTSGDPAITRFLDRRGRAGVPLYLWYSPGSAEPEELPQILTPAILTARALASRRS